MIIYIYIYIYGLNPANKSHPGGSFAAPSGYWKHQAAPGQCRDQGRLGILTQGSLSDLMIEIFYPSKPLTDIIHSRGRYHTQSQVYGNGYVEFLGPSIIPLPFKSFIFKIVYTINYFLG